MVKTDKQLVGLICKQVKMRIGSLSSYPNTRVLAGTASISCTDQWIGT